MTDDDTTIKLTRRKALGGLAVLGTAGATAGAGSYALFSDSQKAMNHVYMGDLDLQMDALDGTSASGEWTLNNAQPGNTATGEVTLKNAGSEEADHVELEISTSAAEAGNDDDADTMDGADGFSSLLTVTNLQYAPPGKGKESLYDRPGHPTDKNDNGLIDLADLADNEWGVLDDLEPPSPANADETTFRLALYIYDTDEVINDNNLDIQSIPDEVAEDQYRGEYENNDFQGDELEITVTAHLHQEASQDD